MHLLKLGLELNNTVEHTYIIALTHANKIKFMS